jgi:pimeloyl-ACP methyl ester carboxylesterase
MWTEHVQTLVDARFRVIAMDLPGYGEALPSRELAPWIDVRETMDALDVDHAALVGNSFGGAVALRVAVTAPDLVTSLVLVSTPCPSMEEPSSELQTAWEAEESALQRGDISAAVSAVLDAWTLADAPEALRDRVASMQRRAFELQTAAGPPSEPEDPVEADPEALARLDLPALVAAGELDMSDFRLGAEALARELPNARHVVIAGAGHLAPLEQPGTFRTVLTDFLNDQQRS